MLVGCYSIHLYCTNAESDEKECRVGWEYDGPPEYTGKTLQECIRQARRDGWIITNDSPRLTFCPKCAVKRRKRSKVC